MLPIAKFHAALCRWLLVSPLPHGPPGRGGVPGHWQIRNRGLSRLQNVGNGGHPESGRAAFEPRPVCTQSPKPELPLAPLSPARWPCWLWERGSSLHCHPPLSTVSLKEPNMPRTPAEKEQSAQTKGGLLSQSGLLCWLCWHPSLDCETRRDFLLFSSRK